MGKMLSDFEIKHTLKAGKNPFTSQYCVRQPGDQSFIDCLDNKEQMFYNKNGKIC